MRSPTSVLAAVFLAASTLSAQETPKPAPELDKVKYFAGSWSCSGDAPASPFGPAHKTQGSTVMKLDLDGFWYTGMVTETKTPSNPRPVKGMMHVGYDQSAKQYVMVWVDNFGSWASETSPGWQGETLVFSGEQKVMGEKATARDTLVRKSDREYTHKFELEMKGKWNTIVEETCRRK